MIGVPLPAREPGVFWEEPGEIADTTPGTEQTLLSFVAGGGGKRRLSGVHVVCGFDARWRVLVGGTEVGSGATQPGAPMAEFRWWPGRPLADGATVEVKLKAFTGTAVASAQAHAHGYDAP